MDRTPLFPPSSASANELPPIGIAVMGITGSGKSSFINTASGSHLRVGSDLKSCTGEVSIANEFTLDGRRVVLIDTPGFDDSNINDAQILEKVAAFLAETYAEGSRLAGILYVHRISDDRFTGASTRNFKTFRKLCGDSTLKNVVLVTNMWGKVEKDVGEAHEKELTENFFKAALDKGAQLARHYNTTQSAHEIIRRIMKNDPSPLLIQKELVDESRDLKDTSAGEAVNEEMTALIKRHEAEMKALREQMTQALREKDAEWEKELKEETRKITKRLNEVKREMETMTFKYFQERKKTGEMMGRLREQADLDRKQVNLDMEQAILDRRQAEESRKQATQTGKQLGKLHVEFSEVAWDEAEWTDERRERVDVTRRFDTMEEVDVRERVGLRKRDARERDVRERVGSMREEAGNIGGCIFVSGQDAVMGQVDARDRFNVRERLDVRDQADVREQVEEGLRQVIENVVPLLIPMAARSPTRTTLDREYYDVRSRTRTSSALSSGTVASRAQMGEGVPEILIAVMGATGSGKSSFINLVSGSDLGIGRGLRSCTESVQIAGAFYLDGRRIVLIDTPGFDDTTRSDTDVLNMIAAFLETSYGRGCTLAGVLYFHRISDLRMTGVSRKNLNMFRKLCGDDTLKNVVVVTNMWGDVEPEIGNQREEELKREDIFFKPLLAKGARMARHSDTILSGEEIIHLILDNHPLPLRIQRELVDERKIISFTEAGEELTREIDTQIKKHEEEVLTLRREMEYAMEEKDEETRKELEVETKRMQRVIARFQEDSARLESDYKKEKERLETRMEQMQMEARRRAEWVATRYERKIEELQQTLRTNAATSHREKVEMMQQVDHYSRRVVDRERDPGGGGFFFAIGGTLDQFFGL